MSRQQDSSVNSSASSSEVSFVLANTSTHSRETLPPVATNPRSDVPGVNVSIGNNVDGEAQVGNNNTSNKYYQFINVVERIGNGSNGWRRDAWERLRPARSRTTDGNPEDPLVLDDMLERGGILLDNYFLAAPQTGPSDGQDIKRMYYEFKTSSRRGSMGGATVSGNGPPRCRVSAALNYLEVLQSGEYRFYPARKNNNLTEAPVAEPHKACYIEWMPASPQESIENLNAMSATDFTIVFFGQQYDVGIDAALDRWKFVANAQMKGRKGTYVVTGIVSEAANQRPVKVTLRVVAEARKANLRGLVDNHISLCVLCFNNCDNWTLKSVTEAWVNDISQVERDSWQTVLLGFDINSTRRTGKGYMPLKTCSSAARKLGCRAYIECSERNDDALHYLFSTLIGLAAAINATR